MHRIKYVEIKNYKSIKYLKLILTDYTPLVGYNNAGKSNILEALEWFLKSGKLVDTDFNDDRNGEVLEVTGKVEGLNSDVLSMINEKHRKRIEPFIEDESILLKRVMENPGNASKSYIEIQDPTKGKWEKNPNGISNALKELFPEPIFIRAMEDATEDIGKNKSTTTIGRILKDIIEPISEKNKDLIDETLGKLEAMFSADGAERVEDLNLIDHDFEQVVKEFFPGIKLKIHIPPPTIDDIFKSGTVQVEEGKNGLMRGFDALGHGAQRSIQMALIRYLSDNTNSGESGSRKFLLIEEPELYLHPQAITFLSAGLKRLSKGNYQVVFATHSPIFISQKDVGITALIRKNNALGTYRKNTLNEALDEVTEKKGITDTLFRLDNSINILFSDEIVLIEGKTERKIIPKLFESYYDLSQFQTKIGFIETNGAAGVGNATDILDAMGVKFKILVDLDYCFNSAADHGFIDPESTHFKEGIKIIKQFGSERGWELEDDWPSKSSKKLSAEKYVEVIKERDDFREVVSDLHEDLKNKGIWFWKNGAIEMPLGLKNKDTITHKQFIHTLQTKGFEETVEEPKAIVGFFEWMLSGA